MAFQQLRKSTPEQNSLRAKFIKLAAGLQTVCGKLKLPPIADALPELNEVIDKLAQYKEPDFAESFLTVKDESGFLKNARVATEGPGISLDDEGPGKRLVISSAPFPIIDDVTIVREWDDFISGGCGWDHSAQVDTENLSIYPSPGPWAPPYDFVENFQTGADTLQGGGGGGGGPSFADDETASGTQDGVNVTFTLANAPSPAASLQGFENKGQLIYGTDFTLAGSTITMVVPPLAGDVLLWYYRF